MTDRVKQEPTDAQIERWSKSLFGNEFTLKEEQKEWVKLHWGRQGVSKTSNINTGKI